MAERREQAGKGFADARYRALIECLIEERKRLRLTQADVALRLKRHQQFVSRYEIGERRLDVVEFVDVATTLGLDPSILVASVAL